MNLTLNNRPVQSNINDAASLCRELTNGVSMFIKVVQPVIEAQREIPATNFSNSSASRMFGSRST